MLWTLWTRGRGFNGGLATPAVQLPGTLALVIVGALALMADPRAIYAMPLLLPLALLGALEVDTLPRGFSGALDWFGILTFGLLAALVWLLWFDAWRTACRRASRACSATRRWGIDPRRMARPVGVGVPVRCSGWCLCGPRAGPTAARCSTGPPG